MLTSAIYYYFLLYLVKTAYSILNTCKTTFNEAACCGVTNPNFGNGVYLIDYDCINGITNYHPLTNPDELINVLNNSSKPTKIVVHGFLQYGNNSKILSLADAVCENGINNVIILDWGKYAFNFNYLQAAADAFRIGDLFNQCLLKLVTAGLDLSKLHIIGFSLGAHIAGFPIGCNNFVNKSLRITGLDPANPIFYSGECYFNPSNRSAVDVIHTNMGQFGSCCSMGEQEVFVNGGRCQPSSLLSRIDIPDILNYTSNALFTKQFEPLVSEGIEIAFYNHVSALDIYAYSVYYNQYAGKCSILGKLQVGYGYVAFGYNANPDKDKGQYCIAITLEKQNIIVKSVNAIETLVCSIVNTCPLQSNYL